jgi:hypothetical protein
VVETILLSIRTPDSSMNVKISVQCSDKEESGSTGILGESQKDFAWLHEDLHCFDPDFVQCIMKLDRQKQELVNFSLEAPSQRELKDFLRARTFYSVHPEWVSNWELTSRITNNIRTCISLRTFRKVIMRNPFPPLNMEMFLQQVVESQLRPLLDSLFGYKRIKVKGENIHKTTFITNCDTMPYKCFPSGLLDASISLKRPIHTTFNELVSLHAYLDDLIMCVKG